MGKQIKRKQVKKAPNKVDVTAPKRQKKVQNSKHAAVSSKKKKQQISKKLKTKPVPVSPVESDSSEEELVQQNFPVEDDSSSESFEEVQTKIEASNESDSSESEDKPNQMETQSENESSDSSEEEQNIEISEESDSSDEEMKSSNKTEKTKQNIKESDSDEEESDSEEEESLEDNKKENEEEESDSEEESEEANEQVEEKTTKKQSNNVESADIDKSKKTIFIMGLSYDATEDDVHSFFADCGEIENVKVLTHNNTNKPRGLALVEFTSQSSAQKALSKDGEELLNRSIKVQISKDRSNRTEPRKNHRGGIQSDYVKPSPNLSDKPNDCRNVFVANLSWNTDDDMLRDFFGECGDILSARVITDRDSGKSRGFGYVEFASTECVDSAIELHGQQIDGREIRVDFASPRGDGSRGGNNSRGGRGQNRGFRGGNRGGSRGFRGNSRGNRGGFRGGRGRESSKKFEGKRTTFDSD